MANNDSEVDLVQLEKDFKEVENQVNEKLKLAAEAVSEAQAIAKSKGFDLMRCTNDYDNYTTPISMKTWTWLSRLDC